MTPEAPVKDRCCRNRHDGHSPGQPSKDCLNEIHQPLGGFTLRQNVAGEGEEWNRNQSGEIGQSVQLDDQRGGIDARGMKGEKSDRSDNGKKRSAGE